MSGELFTTRNHSSTSARQLNLALRNCGAHDCSILFVHSGLNFGTPRASRTEILNTIASSLIELGTATLCLPTYTFSFINQEVFDPDNTPGRMGALSEFFRKLPAAVRSPDPLMSVTVLGQHSALATAVGSESCGKNSTFHLLRQLEGVKFLFLGVRPQDCFTYMHYLEYEANVPYRFNRTFQGKIRTNNTEKSAAATLFVRYPGVFPGPGNADYEQQLLDNGIATQTPFGDHFIQCLPEAPARLLWLSLLHQNPCYFLKNPFTPPPDPNSDFEHALPMVAM
jgi:aminoglycoside 3-N-acetyltransferase